MFSYNVIGGIMSKVEFKEFVKRNPRLIKYVKNDEMSWQKFYEMYELYGEDNDAWKDYLTDNTDAKAEITKSNATTFGLNEFVNWMKNINLDGIQEGIGNIQRVLGVFQDFSKKDSTTEPPKQEYKPRPLYKHFED